MQNILRNFKKPLDKLLATMYNVARYRKEVLMTENSRADYFKERRKERKAFYVEISREKMSKLEKILSTKKITKKEWLEEKIEEEK